MPHDLPMFLGFSFLITFNSSFRMDKNPLDEDISEMCGQTQLCPCHRSFILGMPCPWAFLL